MAKFTVDTQLFRELGELLVGRDSTAMVELIKNAYDADARMVKVHGANLSNPAKGTIIIADDGTGMTDTMFEEGFLRIAGRTKSTSDRKSKEFGRRFTGEKGIGRLSAHKLGALLHISSNHKSAKAWLDPLEGFRSDRGVAATIDWDEIESSTTLEEVGESNAVRVDPHKNGGTSGTILTIRKLRKSWTSRDLDSFFSDVLTLVPGPSLTSDLPQGLVEGVMLFDRNDCPQVRDSDSADPGFSIEFAGELSDHESDVPAAAEAAAWVIEIDCNAKKRRVSVAVEPTRVAKSSPKQANAEGWRSTYTIPKGEEAVSFNARIFEREGERWSRLMSGVRVYYEGFRVPPYGDIKDDWINLDTDYRRRGRGELGRLRRFSSWDLPAMGDDGEGLIIKGNEHYYGAVFLTRGGAESLQMLINREGFLPGPSWDFVRDVVAWAISAQVRQRRLGSFEAVRDRKIDLKGKRDLASRTDESVAPAVVQAKEASQQVIATMKEARSLLAAGKSVAAREALMRGELEAMSAQELATRGASEAVMLRVLSSLGLEQAAFVHEILGLGQLAETIAKVLLRISKSVNDQKLGRRIGGLAAEAGELRDRLRRNGIYLSDMAGVEGRKRRIRVKLRDRFEHVQEFFKSSAARRSITIVNEIPEKLVSPPIFPAEATAMFSNLLSNALKFAGSPGQVLAIGETTDDEVIVRVENSGKAVKPNQGEKWFEPFRSTTAKVDATLGQGMGLGLTISRSLMDEYGGTIQFVTPAEGYATAVELRWPKR